MYKIILFLNLSLNLIYLGVQYETKEFNRFNNVPLTQLVTSELLENILKYNETSATVKSKMCDKNKNTQLRLSDEEEQNWMPLFYRKIKPNESLSNKVDNIKLNYSQLQKLTFVNNSNMQNIDEYRETNELHTVSNTLLHELRNNENKFQKQKNKSDIKREKANDDNDLNLLPIDTRKGHYAHTHLDNKKTDFANEELTVTQAPELITSTRKSTISKTTKGNIGKLISNDAYIVNSEDDNDEDISFSSESNEINNDNGTETDTHNKSADSEKINELVKTNKENEDDESGSIEYTDKSLNLNKIKKHFEFRNGMKITDSSNSRILLMKSHRICYACVSSSDASCLKPNRQTTVKYCHRDNTACVAKSYTIGRSNYIMRDCGTSCISSDINSLDINYETCSICHSDLCNSAYSINTFIAPMILLSIVINKIIYY